MLYSECQFVFNVLRLSKQCWTFFFFLVSAFQGEGFFFFNLDHFFLVFFKFVTILGFVCFFVLLFLFFGHKAFGILAPRPGMKPAPPRGIGSSES